MDPRFKSAFETALAETKVVDELGRPRRVYHGTPHVFERFSRPDPTAMYGPGYYFTENPDIASEYAENIKRFPGHRLETLRPNVRQHYLALKNPFDIDAPAPGRLVDQVLSFYDRDPGQYFTPARETIQTGGDLYSRLSKLWGHDKTRVNRWLEEQGYDAITHIGGRIMGSREHRVWIALHPEQIFRPGPGGPQSMRFDWTAPSLKSTGQLIPLGEIGIAKKIAARGTLHEHHVNLESKVGQFFKKLWKLPFKKHSRVDPLKSALFAAARFVKSQGTFDLGKKVAQFLGNPNQIRRYEAVLSESRMAYAPFADQIKGVLGAGGDAMVFELEGDQVFKLFRRGKGLKGGFGVRHFDAPVLQHGTIHTPLGEFPYAIQKKAAAVTAEEAAAWEREITAQGYQFWDPGERQLGKLDGEVRLLDYRAVNTPENNMRGTRPGAGHTQKVGRAVNYLVEGSPYSTSEPLQVREFQTARTVARRGTVNERHVNLESPIGQHLKLEMNLPFKQHSTIDPLPNALFAEGHAARPATSFVERLLEQAQAGERPDLITKNLRRYATALEPFAEQIEKPLGAGITSLAVQLRGGHVLKFAAEELQEGLGTRAFDAPILARGTVKAAGQTSHFMVQPKVEMAQTPAESQRFFSALKKAGYEGWDPGERQFGYHRGQAVLIDYDAATIQSGRADFPSRAPARQLPRAMEIEVGEQTIQRRMASAVAETKTTFYRPVAESAEQSVAFQSLPQAISRTAIKEGLAEPVRVAQMVQPTARQGANTAQAMAARATMNELHQNLESKAGQFFKKVMKLPFQKWSRLDPMAAATQAARGIAQTVAENVSRLSFTPAKAGILLGGTAVVLGGLFLAKKSLDSGETQGSHDGSVSHQIDRGRQEGKTTEASVRSTTPAAPRGSTHIQISDAPLNTRDVEDALSHHLTRGYAY